MVSNILHFQGSRLYEIYVINLFYSKAVLKLLYYIKLVIKQIQIETATERGMWYY